MSSFSLNILTEELYFNAKYIYLTFFLIRYKIDNAFTEYTCKNKFDQICLIKYNSFFVLLVLDKS